VEEVEESGGGVVEEAILFRFPNGDPAVARSFLSDREIKTSAYFRAARRRRN
jgi:hypothetical protein